MQQDKQMTTELGISSYIRGIALGSYCYHGTARRRGSWSRPPSMAT
jgi:hypothetical protein